MAKEGPGEVPLAFFIAIPAVDRQRFVVSAPSGPIPKFVIGCGTFDTSFGIKGPLATL
jgi:hypothetical protein